MKWKSTGEYKHPDNKLCGKVARRADGSYLFICIDKALPPVNLECSQAWAKAIHRAERKTQSITVRVPREIIALIHKERTEENRDFSNMVNHIFKQHYNKEG